MSTPATAADLSLGDLFRLLLPHVGNDGRVARYWTDKPPPEVTRLVREHYLREDGIEIAPLHATGAAVGPKRYRMTPSGRTALDKIRRADRA